MVGGVVALSLVPAVRKAFSVTLGNADLSDERRLVSVAKQCADMECDRILDPVSLAKHTGLRQNFIESMFVSDEETGEAPFSAGTIESAKQSAIQNVLDRYKDPLVDRSQENVRLLVGSQLEGFIRSTLMQLAREHADVSGIEEAEKRIRGGKTCHLLRSSKNDAQ
jgi:hypothetical protein